MVADGDGRKMEAGSVRHFQVHIFRPSSVVEIAGDQQIREQSDGPGNDDEPQEPASRDGSGKFRSIQKKVVSFH